MYQKRLNQVQKTSALHEHTVDSLKFENRSLLAELNEVKKDCESMGRLIEEEALRSEKLDLMVKKSETMTVESYKIKS